MQIDRKIGSMSTGMQTRTEFGCVGKRYRVVGLDSMTASIKGVPVADSIAKQVNAAQSAKAVGDTAWKSAPDCGGMTAVMLSAVCAKLTPAPTKA